jgi:hypothetical protein
MHLADHRVARDAAEFLGDLAGGLALPPHLLEQFDAFVGPGHAVLRFDRPARGLLQTRHMAMPDLE